MGNSEWMAETDHEKLAEDLEREADKLERQSEELHEQADGAREDWERKRRDSKVPGAPQPEEAGNEDPSEQQTPPWRTPARRR